MNLILHTGLDVHNESIAVALAREPPRRLPPALPPRLQFPPTSLRLELPPSHLQTPQNCGQPIEVPTVRQLATVD